MKIVIVMCIIINIINIIINENINNVCNVCVWRNINIINNNV